MTDYRYNQCVKHYPNGDMKITTFNDDVYNPFHNDVITKPRLDYSKKNNETRLDSLKRSKDKIFDIAILNKFEFFITFTLDKSKIDRYDYNSIQSKLKSWLKNKVQRNGLKYLIVPELHSDGAVHFHGLVSGNLELINSGHLTNDHKIIYNTTSWQYGYTTVVELSGSYEAVAHYVTKYITKDTKRILGNIYYAGGNINREVNKTYCKVNYGNSLGKEYTIGNTRLKVKYYDYRE